MAGRWSRILSRLAVVATALALFFAIASAPAPAHSHWGTHKCDRVYSNWFKHHKHATSHQITKYLKKLEKQHKCQFGG